MCVHLLGTTMCWELCRSCSPVFSHLILTRGLEYRFVYNHFTDEETEALGGKVTWPRSYRQEVAWIWSQVCLNPELLWQTTTLSCLLWMGVAANPMEHWREASLESLSPTERNNHPKSMPSHPQNSWENLSQTKISPRSCPKLAASSSSQRHVLLL